jgi:hypothetical protein
VTGTAQSLLDAARSGVYRAPLAPDLLRQAAVRSGLAYFSVDLVQAGDKARFLGACAAGLRFPASFGLNWDAFADSLQDFSWRTAKGYLIHLRHASSFARAAPEDYATAIEILREAAAFWKQRGTAFITLVDDAADLPVFAA